MVERKENSLSGDPEGIRAAPVHRTHQSLGGRVEVLDGPAVAAGLSGGRIDGAGHDAGEAIVPADVVERASIGCPGGRLVPVCAIGDGDPVLLRCRAEAAQRCEENLACARAIVGVKGDPTVARGVQPGSGTEQVVAGVFEQVTVFAGRDVEQSDTRGTPPGHVEEVPAVGAEVTGSTAIVTDAFGGAARDELQINRL